MSEVKHKPQRRKIGVVVSDKCDKTIVVMLQHRIRHPLYKKYITRSTRVKAHDEHNQATVGHRVAIVEGRPVSKDKCWYLSEVLQQQ